MLDIAFAAAGDLHSDKVHRMSIDRLFTQHGLRRHIAVGVGDVETVTQLV